MSEPARTISIKTFRLWVAVVALMLALVVAGWKWPTFIEQIDRWQTLITGILALIVGFLTITRIDHQIAETRLEQERSRRAMIAGQNQPAIERINLIGLAVASFRDRLRSVGDNATWKLRDTVTEELHLNRQRYFDLEEVEAYYLARFRVLALADRFFSDSDQETTPKAKRHLDAIEETAILTSLLRDMALLLGEGYTLRELSKLTSRQIAEAAHDIRPPRENWLLALRPSPGGPSAGASQPQTSQPGRARRALSSIFGSVGK